MMDFLSCTYPSLFIFMLEKFEMTDMIEQYMSKCKKHENNPEKFSLYVHGYFLVWLDQQRQQGNLTQGTLKLNFLIALRSEW